jgi:tRNA isopentenyl-2-thiomethyl-A-37 hydroxylase MiaE
MCPEADKLSTQDRAKLGKFYQAKQHSEQHTIKVRLEIDGKRYGKGMLLDEYSKDPETAVNQLTRELNITIKNELGKLGVPGFAGEWI